MSNVSSTATKVHVLSLEFEKLVEDYWGALGFFTSTTATKDNTKDFYHRAFIRKADDGSFLYAHLIFDRDFLSRYWDEGMTLDEAQKVVESLRWFPKKLSASFYSRKICTHEIFPYLEPQPFDGRDFGFFMYSCEDKERMWAAHEKNDAHFRAKVARTAA